MPQIKLLSVKILRSSSFTGRYVCRASSVLIRGQIFFTAYSRYFLCIFLCFTCVFIKTCFSSSKMDWRKFSLVWPYFGRKQFTMRKTWFQAKITYIWTSYTNTGIFNFVPWFQVFTHSLTILGRNLKLCHFIENNDKIIIFIT